MKTIKLPSSFSNDEIEFIENWYSEDGMQQLRASNTKPFSLVDEKPPVKGTKYVNVENTPVQVIHRDPKTLRAIAMKELKTVKLLLLDAWIIEVKP